MTHTDHESLTGEVRHKVDEVREEVKEALRHTQEEYAHGEDRPLAGYVEAMGAYGAFIAGLSVAGKLTGKRLPDSIAPGDFALLAVGTHKLSRIIAKDAITSPLRAPFTRYREPAGASELNEDVRATSAKGHALGELLECPFCLAVWTSTALFATYVFSPRKGRAAATVMSMTAVSDMLQFVYNGLKQKAG